MGQKSGNGRKSTPGAGFEPHAKESAPQGQPVETPDPDSAATTARPAASRSRAKAKRPEARIRFSGDLPAPLAGFVPYAKSRAELKTYTDAQIVRDILDSDAWREVMQPILVELDRERRRPGKVAPLYTSAELESVHLLQIVSGIETVKETRDNLTNDRNAEARELLGFARPRPLPGQRVVKLRSGIPSDATLCRHRQHFVEQRRLDAYKALERRLLLEHAATDELRAEADLINMDGTAIVTHYTAPVIDPKTDVVVNSGVNARGYPKITAPDAGFNPKLGHGWNLVMATTQTGVILSWEIVPANISEKVVGRRVVDALEDVLPHLGTPRLRVLTADGGFNAQPIRQRARELGILENVHKVSHDAGSRSKADDEDKRRIPIESHKDWFTNGHRELRCRCGQGRTVKRVKLGPKGTAIARNEGQCGKCGSITITSGDWYVAQNPTKWRRANPKDTRQRVDYSMGNPLTFHDPVSEQYGNRRFGRNEGLHGALSTRFKLIEGKRWFRRPEQAATAVSMTACVIHAVSLEQRRRARASGVAPPLAA
jgi:hypothetical protein